MSSSKKEVIVGAVIVMVISLWLITVGISTTEATHSSSSLSGSLNSLISWLATIVSIFGVAGGLLLIFQSDKPAIKKWIERYTVKATIPSYFVFSLVPLMMGLLLLVALRQTTWGLGLACLSVPSALVFLIFGLRKKDQS